METPTIKVRAELSVPKVGQVVDDWCNGMSGEVIAVHSPTKADGKPVVVLKGADGEVWAQTLNEIRFSAPAPTAPHIRPGLVYYSSAWTGPTLVLDRDGDDVHILTSCGYSTTDVGSILSEEPPVAGSALAALADHIATGFVLHRDTRPFAVAAAAPKPSTSPMPPPSSESAVGPLDVRKFHAMIVELGAMFQRAVINGDSDNKKERLMAMAIDGGVVPQLSAMNGDHTGTEEAISHLEFFAENMLGEATTVMLNAKIEAEASAKVGKGGAK